jgi:hypothetical protein
LHAIIVRLLLLLPRKLPGLAEQKRPCTLTAVRQADPGYSCLTAGRLLRGSPFPAGSEQSLYRCEAAGALVFTDLAAKYHGFYEKKISGRFC